MNTRDRTELGFERWGILVCRYRWLAIAAMVGLTVALASGVARLTVESSTESYLDPSDPERANYDAFRRQYTNDDPILLILHSERVFGFEFLERLRALHEDLEGEIDTADEVISLVNARVIRGTEDALIVGELLEEWPREPRLPQHAALGGRPLHDRDGARDAGRGRAGRRCAGRL